MGLGGSVVPTVSRINRLPPSGMFRIKKIMKKWRIMLQEHNKHVDNSENDMINRIDSTAEEDGWNSRIISRREHLIIADGALKNE